MLPEPTLDRRNSASHEKNSGALSVTYATGTRGSISADSRRSAAAFIRFAMNLFDHDEARRAIA
jgi:hypothetical protein